MISVKRAALSLGALFGVLHFAGVLLVALTAGAVVQWAMSLHHMRANFVYLPLDVVNLIIGTVLAAIVGAVVGALFAAFWNMLKD